VQGVTINDIPFTVIGVLTSAGSDSSTNLDDQAIVPTSTAASQLVAQLRLIDLHRGALVVDPVGGLREANDQLLNRLTASWRRSPNTNQGGLFGGGSPHVVTRR
jgi:hypothetical protein